MILIKLSSRPNIFDAGGPSLLHDANLRLISKLKPASEKKVQVSVSLIEISVTISQGSRQASSLSKI